MNIMLKWMLIAILSLLPSQPIFLTEIILELGNARDLVVANENMPQKTVFVGEMFELKVIVKNADSDTGDVNIGGIEKLQVSGRSSSSSVTMINGRFTAEKVYTYQVCAPNEGIFEIGPAQVQQNSNSISSNVIKFRSINRPEKFRDQNSGTDQAEDNFIECELLPDKNTMFEGEILTLVLKIKCYGNIHQVGLDAINFKDFQTRENEKVERKQETKNGKTYEVLEKKVYLIPMQSGIHKIGPAKVIYQVPKKRQNRMKGFFNDDFFNLGGLFDQMQLVQKQSLSNVAQIKVQQIPQCSEAIDGVGRFKYFNCSVDKKIALLNEAIKLTFSLEGEGNFEQVTTPKLNLGSLVNSYESKISFEESPSNKHFSGKKIFEFIIQVSKAGEVVIPAQKFTYFDTETKSVKTLETAPITLQINHPIGEPVKVNESVAEQGDVPGPKNQEFEVAAAACKDIGFIEPNWVVARASACGLPFWVLLVLLLLPIVFYTRIVRCALAKLVSDKMFTAKLNKSALKKCLSEFERIKNNKNIEQLYYFFLKFLAIKFELPQQDISHDKIVEGLYSLGFEADKINDFLDFINECASLHFMTSENKETKIICDDILKKSEYWIIVLTR